MEKGKIVILNGVSSSGKTTLATALQEQSKEVFYRISVDDFCHMIPEKDWGFETFMNAVEVMLRTIRTFSELGLSVVVDVVIQESLGLLPKFEKHLAGLPVLMVHVHCPIEEQRRRELARGDREAGQGEDQLSDLVPRDNYDLDIDTFAEPTEDSVKRIIAICESLAS